MRGDQTTPSPLLSLADSHRGNSDWPSPATCFFFNVPTPIPTALHPLCLAHDSLPLTSYLLIKPTLPSLTPSRRVQNIQ